MNFLVSQGLTHMETPYLMPTGNYIEISKKICLTELKLSSPAVVISVSDQSSEILELLEHKKIAIGTRLEIKKRFEFDNSMEIRIGRQPVFTISEQLAQNIFVQSNS